jgi:4-amino-4-deoxy-L-arabinose transferase-like glycosyltransferase
MVIAFFTLFFRLGALPLTGADEPRYARIAEEMHDRGEWVTPELQGKPWLEKPPLYYWITKPFYSVFSSPEVAARVGSALCGLITALAVYWVGLTLWTPLAGFIGSAMLLTTLGLAGFGRSATTDMPFTCCLTLAMAILVIAVEKDIGWKVLAAYVFLGLAVLGKGPVAGILVAGVALAFWFLNERGGAMRRWRPLLGGLVALAVALPWFWLAFRENGYAFIATFFINHNLARYATDIHHHAQPFYYYLPVLLALVFPWSGWLLTLWPQSLGNSLQRWREWRPADVFVVCWFCLPIFFFSLSGSKLPGYILPSLPPLALLVGARLASAIEGRRAVPRLRAALWLHLILSFGMAVAAPVFFQKDYGGSLVTGLWISAAVLPPAIVAFVCGLKGNCIAAVRASMVQGTLLVAVVAFFAFPVLGDYHSTRTLARQALSARLSEHEPVAMYRFFHHTLQYYTGYLAETQLDDCDALRRFADIHPTFLVVTKETAVRELLRGEGCAGISTQVLHRQGNFFLARVNKVEVGTARRVVRAVSAKPPYPPRRQHRNHG